MTKPETYRTIRVTPASPDAVPRHGTAVWAGLLCCVAAGVLVVGCLVTQWQVAITTVSDDAWRFPWSPTAFIATTLLWAATQAALVPALVAFQRSGAAGIRATARWGLRLVVTGTVVGVVAHLASLPFVDSRLGDLMVLAAVFGMGALLSTVGFLMAGVGTVRAARWTGLFRWTPLGIGLAGVALMFLQFTPLLPTGVGIYYLGFILLGLAIGVHVEHPVEAGQPTVLLQVDRDRHRRQTEPGGVDPADDRRGTCALQEGDSSGGAQL